MTTGNVTELVSVLELARHEVLHLKEVYGEVASVDLIDTEGGKAVVIEYTEEDGRRRYWEQPLDAKVWRVVKWGA